MATASSRCRIAISSTLPGEIDGIARVRLDLRADRGRDRAKVRPNGHQTIERDAGQRQQLEGAAPAAVAADVETVFSGFIGRQGQLLETIPR